MKNKWIFFVNIIFIMILTIGIVSATDNITSDSLNLENHQEDAIEILQNSSDVIINDEHSKISDYDYSVNVPKNMNPNKIWEISVNCMPNDAKGNISMSIDDIERYNKPVSIMKNALLINDLNLNWGIHNLTIKYGGDDKYEGFINTTQFEYNYITVDVPNEIDENSPISIDSINGATGNIKFLIDGKSVLDKKLDSENNLIYLNKYSIGYHTYEFIYSNGNYKGFTKKGSFNITYNFYIQDYHENYTIFYGDSQEFEVVLPENAKSNIYVNLNDKIYKFKSKGEINEFKLSEFDLGENNVSISYEDSRYTKNTINTKVIVLPKLILPVNVEYKNNNNISLIMPNTTQGILTVTINGKNYTANLENGKAIISLNDLIPGQYNVTAGYEGDFSQYIEPANYTIDVIPHLEIPTEMSIHEDNKILFTAPKDYNGKLYLSGLIDDTINIENGSAVIPLTNLKVGSYTLYAKYENFTWEIPIDINEGHYWNMEISYPAHIASFYSDYEWYDYDDYVIHVVNSPENISGKFAIYHDGKFIRNVKIDNDYEPGYLTFIQPKFNEIKKHTIKICYLGDKYFQPVNKTLTYEVANYDFTLYDDGIRVHLPADAKGKLIVKVNGTSLGQQKVAPNEDREVQSYYFTSNNLKYGKTYEIQIQYGSGNYPKFTKKEICKLDYDIIIYAHDNYEYGAKNTIDFSLPWDSNKKATVTIDGVKYNHSYCTVDISKLKPGNHILVVTYKDNKYPTKSSNVTFSVGAEIKTPEEGIFKYLSKNSVSVLLPTDAVGNLTVEIDYGRTGEYELFKSVSVKDGKASIILPSDRIGNYIYRAYFEGNYDLLNKTYYITVVPIFNVPDTIKYGESKSISVQIDNQTQAKLLIVADEDFEFPILEVDINSTNNVVVLNKELCDQVKSIVEYNGKEFDYYKLRLIGYVYVNGDYLTTCFETYVKYTPKLITKNVKMQYLDGHTFTVKVYDIFGKLAVGKIVNFKIGSNTYKAKTDKKGIATLKLKLIPSTYTVKTTFQGLTMKNTIKVKQILTLKKVKVKKYAKKLVLNAKLVKVNGKFLKGKKITFKFNGKKYVAKTNKKGIAKVTIKKSTLRKLKIGKKITYTATYVKTTVKQTVKIKK